MDRLRGLRAIHGRLQGVANVGELLARACVEACGWCGFSRGVIVSLEAGRLGSGAMDAVADPACDAMRRLALAHPVAPTPGSQEAELLRRGADERRGRPAAESVLKRELALEEHAIAPIAPEGRTVALLVLDRSQPAVEEIDLCAVELFAHVLGLDLERVVLRLRLRELSAELRHFTASAQALVQESINSPVGVTVDYGHGPVFPLADGGITADELAPLLTRRERQIADMLVEGRSNREIAELLYLSPETIKTHVAHLLRKLGVSNRMEAVARLTRNGGPSGRNSEAT